MSGTPGYTGFSLAQERSWSTFRPEHPGHHLHPPQSPAHSFASLPKPQPSWAHTHLPDGVSGVLWGSPSSDLATVHPRTELYPPEVETSLGTGSLPPSAVGAATHLPLCGPPLPHHGSAPCWARGGQDGSLEEPSHAASCLGSFVHLQFPKKRHTRNFFVCQQAGG